MIGGGSEAPPPNGGEFLLRLLKNSNQYSSQPQQSQFLTHDPAVAEIGPSIPILQRNGLHPAWPQHQYLHVPPSQLPPSGQYNLGNDVRRNLGLPLPNQQEQTGLVFGSFSEGSKTGFLAENPSVSGQSYLRRGFNGVEVGFQPNSADIERDKSRNSVDSRIHHVHEGRTYNSGDRHWDNNEHKDSRVHVQDGRNYSKGTAAFPGANVRQDIGYTNRRGFEQIGARGSTNFVNSSYQSGNNMERPNKSVLEQHKNARWEDRKMDNKLNYPSFSQVSTSSSVSASSALESVGHDTEKEEIGGNEIRDDKKIDFDLDKLKKQLEDTLDLGDKVEEKIEGSKHHKSRDKEYRSDKRGQSILGQRMRYMKRQIPCRVDIETWNIPFLAIYESLIPAEDEKLKQKQLLTLLENIVCKEWPGARLYLYGSCANSFGFPNSDLDVCLTIDSPDLTKSDVLLKLADLLLLENLVNVQALTRARVPIVKLMDPKTGISCDICVNNVLAVVNTKLLRDYAEIDSRLRQLAFMVKHWAKSRGVNETYQGTLSSYAYVLMCINFLQLRRPAILPCLQEMTATFTVNVDNAQCSFFDRVEKLVGYGSNNRESISGLLWSFFHYWAYCHDYTNDVISVRTGRILSKRFKDWTRRIGNDRHLICIEDPFELTHDLGRVVDKMSIKVLREEFERAAEIMQYDPNPCVTLFEPYISS